MSKVEEGVFKFNDMEFERLPGVEYYVPYWKLPGRVAAGEYGDVDLCRALCQQDLFWLIYFILGIKPANHGFVVQACTEVQDGPRSHTLDIWAREHFKSTIITIAETIQDILVNPEERICIFSHNKATALSFFRAIKFHLESNKTLKACFPDILYENPEREAFKWSEDSGLYVKRAGAYKEPTLSASGLIDGMPTGSHFTRRKYDDVETEALTYTPEITQKLKDAYDMSVNLGTDDGTVRVIGTFYDHNGLLCYLEDKKNADGTSLFTTRKKPATEGGELHGKAVLKSEERLSELRLNLQMFYSQQLCDPTPREARKLNPELLKFVRPDEVPENLVKVMTIDPAGSAKRSPDAWGIFVLGIEPWIDDEGSADLYILDMVIESMDEATALKTVAEVYLRNQRISKVGVEKVGLSSVEIHVANTLRSRGILLTIEAGNLVALRPAGRRKEDRILQNLMWPVNNGKVKVLKSIPACYQGRLKLEMEKFPYWHDDGLDALAYAYDIYKDFRFWKNEVVSVEKKERDPYDEDDEVSGGELNWYHV